MSEVRIPAFAKINVRLKVVGKRPDGFHELRTIFQSISLHDELLLRRAPGKAISLRVSGNAMLSTEPVEKNLVYRAVDLLRRELRLRDGVAMELQKNVPAGRGLGGGSSDAAAALLGFLRLTGKKLDEARLFELAASLGADVPFFLQGGRALGVGKGDEIYPLPDVAKQYLLVVSPESIHVPTPDAYRWLAAGPIYVDEQKRMAKEHAEPHRTRKSPEQSKAGRRALTKRGKTSSIWGFCALCWSAQGTSLSNDFEGPVFERYPRLQQIKRVLLQHGAAEASLAGSGSAVFGVFPSPVLARRAAVRFPHDQTFVSETVSRDRYVRAVTGASVR
jgi:4-diphosphocytidyl-2-C-methyl-D-erythritol kinase